jgi:hypothetical protein
MSSNFKSFETHPRSLQPPPRQSGRRRKLYKHLIHQRWRFRRWTSLTSCATLYKVSFEGDSKYFRVNERKGNGFCTLGVEHDWRDHIKKLVWLHIDAYVRMTARENTFVCVEGEEDIEEWKEKGSLAARYLRLVGAA